LILQASTVLAETVFPFFPNRRNTARIEGILPSPFRYGCASLAKNKQFRLWPSRSFIWNSGVPARHGK
jgi:hypothetical protein